MNVAVVGASHDPDTYSNKAVRLLIENGHRVFPVNPGLKEVEGLPSYASLADIPEPVDTVTLYVSRKISSKIKDEILTAAPRRIIFNPGAENADVRVAAEQKGITTIEACTLVMLKTSQFEKK